MSSLLLLMVFHFLGCPQCLADLHENEQTIVILYYDWLNYPHKPPKKTFCYNWRSFHWSDPSDQTAQQWRCFIRNTGFAKTLGSWHKEEWGLYWKPVKGFCKINNFVQYSKDCAQLLKSPSFENVPLCLIYFENGLSIVYMLRLIYPIKNWLLPWILAQEIQRNSKRLSNNPCSESFQYNF